MNSNVDIFDLCINRAHSCLAKAFSDYDMSEEELSAYQLAVLDIEFELKKLRLNYNMFLEENE